MKGKISKAGKPAKPAAAEKASSKRRLIEADRSVPVALPAEGGPAGATAGELVYGMATAGDRLLAGTSHGLLRSDDSGRTWKPVPTVADEDWRFVAGAARSFVAATLNEISLSKDGGESWSTVSGPQISQVSAVAMDDKGEIWVGSREGVYLSSDKGMTWQTLNNLYVRNVDSLFYDAASQQVFVTASGPGTLAFALRVGDRKVSFWDTGWYLRSIRPVGDHLLGATLFDGVVIQPRMVESKVAAAK